MKNFINGIMFVLLLQVCSADDIYLKDGTVIKNVKFLEYRKNFGQLAGFFLFNNKEYFYNVDIISRIDPVPYDPASASVRGKLSPVDLVFTPLVPPQVEQRPKDTLKILYERLATLYAPPRKVYPNLIWLSVTALSMMIALDAFSAADDFQDQIDYNENLRIAWKKAFDVDLQIDNSTLESAKTRKSALGIISLCAGIASFSYSIQSIEVKSDGSSLSLAYHF